MSCAAIAAWFVMVKRTGPEVVLIATEPKSRIAGVMANGVGPPIGVGEAVGVAVAVRVGVPVAVGVRVFVGVGLAVSVGVGPRTVMLPFAVIAGGTPSLNWNPGWKILPGSV